MNGEVRLRAKARQDLFDIFRRYVREAGVGVARRFRSEAEGTFSHLACMPTMGTRYKHNHPALAELRFLPLSSPFDKYLVFCRLVSEGVEIVRILHGARDLQHILAEEFGIRNDL